MGRNEPERKRRSTQPTKPHRRRRTDGVVSTPEASPAGRRTGSLSAEALAQLNRDNGRAQQRRRRESRPPHGYKDERLDAKGRGRKKRRMVSGALMEEGKAGKLRGGAGSEDKEKLLYHKKRRRRGCAMSRTSMWILLGVGIVTIVVVVVVAVVLSRQNSTSSGSGPSTTSLDDLDRDSVPTEHQGTYLDPWTWYDTTDFNVTYTDATVGGLPLIGLYTSWDDSKAANSHVPPLDKPWGSYSDKPARGVNLGGWLSLEPFITPSLFEYEENLDIRDEWTLCKRLGPEQAAKTIEKHYATFVTESTFADIAAAGLDHVRLPFSYWAVEVYDDDPYVFRTSWRYLLRAIEWARKYGLRVNLDLHGAPGSQNGWNHSGRWGQINWITGSSGSENMQRSLDVHDRLSKFFAQDRYKNIITHYGAANEPKMTKLPAEEVIAWTEQVHAIVRANGISAIVVFGDGFMGLHKWQGVMSDLDGLALDVHQYIIFNAGLITMKRQDKIKYACEEWTRQSLESMDRSTGFGPTLFAEWSQADTDCARHLTNVGWGNRWTGTYEAQDDASLSVLEPRCPTQDDRCSCERANSSPAGYEQEYKDFLRMFAEAQMHSFEKGWGWWYWTWETENAPLWSYKAGLAAGILPDKAYEREFDCSGDIPSFDGLPEYI